MANHTTRANLAAAIIPFHTDFFGRSIIVSGFDQNYDKSVISSADTDKDKGIPQLMYAHNAVPNGQGIQSIGYDNVLSAVADETDFDSAFPIQTVDLARVIFSPSGGKNYIFDGTIGHWASVSPLVPGSVRANALVTTAFVQGETYIYYEKLGCFKYNTATKTLLPVVLGGLVAANILGIASVNGYMVAWTDVFVAWSSLISPIDFVPSLTTGAGGVGLNDAQGKINFILPISGGMVVYCEKNSVGGRFSGNATFPFTFAAIPGSGGCASPDLVSWQSNLAEHYAWSSIGLQQIDKLFTKNVFPEATDFLAGKIFEDFNEATLQLSTTALGGQLSIKLAAISSRFLIVSYGITFPNYTHALLYDITLKRWGKLKIDHRDCFQWNFPNLYGPITYGMLTGTYAEFGPYVTYGDLNTSIDNPELVKKSIAFLQKDGTVKIVNFDFINGNSSGVVITGKYQFRRTEVITHHEAEIETVRDTDTFNYYVLPSLDGKDFQPAVPGFLARAGQLVRLYKKRVTGQNFCCIFKGAFNLNSFLITFTSGGFR